MDETIVLVAFASMLSSCVILLVGNFKPRTYVLVLMVVATWLILYPQLRSPYVVGIDAHWERVIAEQTLATGYWDSSQVGNIVNGALSIAMFEPIISLTSGLPLDPVSKLVFSGYTVLGIPILWRLAKRLLGLDNRQAFLSLLLVIGTSSFMLSSAYSREEIATFAMLVALYFILLAGGRSAGRLASEAAVILLTTGVIVSHYATALIYVSVLVPSTFVIRLRGDQKQGFEYVAVAGVLMISWIVFLATLLLHTVTGLTGVLGAISSLASDRVSNVVQDQLNPASQGSFQLINFTINVCILASLLTGVLVEATRQLRKESASEGRKRYAVFSVFLALAFLGSFLPGASLVYNPERLFLMVLLISGGYCILGIQELMTVFHAVGRRIRLSRGRASHNSRWLAVVVATCLVVLHFALQVGVPSEVLTGTSDTKYFDTIEGDIHYTLQGEMSGVGWITGQTLTGTIVYTDFYGRGYLPLQSYGLLPSQDVRIVYNAGEVAAVTGCGLFYQQKATLALTNGAFTGQQQAMVGLDSFLLSQDRVYDSGYAMVYALCGSNSP